MVCLGRRAGPRSRRPRRGRATRIVAPSAARCRGHDACRMVGTARRGAVALTASGQARSWSAASVALEVLDLPLVLFCCFARFESAEVPPLSGLWILLPRVEPISAGLQLFDHESLLS